MLNAESGTLRDVDIGRLGALIERVLGEAGHEIVSLAPADRPIDEALEEAFEGGIDCLLVGGGDGSISAAAALAWRRGAILAVLPGGTMNLYARTLGLPLDVEEAVRALGTARVRAVDIATANGRPFLHQFSVGIHANAVRLRQNASYDSRLGKLAATVGAFWRAVVHPIAFGVVVGIDGAAGERERLSALSVSNNLFGRDHLPYADDPAGGTLGVYRGAPGGFTRVAGMVIDVMLGRARANEDIRIDRAERVELRFPRRNRRLKALLDGELIDATERVEIVMHPGELRVLLPESPSSGTTEPSS